MTSGRVQEAGRKNIYFIFGDPDRLSGVEDFFVLLDDLTKYCLGAPCFLSEKPVAGHWNVYCEFFDSVNRSQLQEAKEKHPGTRAVCIATEMPTGETFNRFERDAHSTSSILQRQVMRLRNFLYFRGLFSAVKKQPLGESMLRLYRKLNSGTDVSQYSNPGYWKVRYDNFVQTLPYLDHVWYVDPGQEPGYSAIVDRGKLWHMPIIPFVDVVPKEEALCFQPDVDFLFTGTQTPYRLRAVSELRRMSFEVVSGFYPEVIRRSFLERSKVCLHIKPHEGWSVPSPLRLHTLLMTGKRVVAEGEPPTDGAAAAQSPFVEWASSEKFLETAAKAAKDDPLEHGLKARADYIAATRELRMEVKRDVERIFLVDARSAHSLSGHS